MKTINEKKGISLIVLVITIIVMIILATAIILKASDSGIVDEPKHIINDTNIASIKEEVQMMSVEYWRNKRINGKDLTEYLNEKKDKKKIDSFTDNGDGTITIELDGYEVIVNADNFNIESVGKIEGIIPKVTATIYQVNGNAIVEGTTYNKVAITVKVTNKTEFTNVTSVVLKNEDGTEIEKYDSLIGDSSADASYIVAKDGKYIVSVKGTKDGITKEKKLSITVSQIGLKVGDYINYTPDTASAYTKLTSANTGSSSNSTPIVQDNLKWQILKINEDGSIDLIGSVTSQYIYLKGALGYNNAVYLINDICKSLYSKNSVGITARSVNLKDFEYWLNKSTGGVAARDSFSYGSLTYNTPKQYTDIWNNYKPDILGKTQNESDAYYTSPTTNTYSGGGDSDTVDVKQTYYKININETNYGEGYKALMSSTPAWIASRSIRCNASYARFGLYYSNDMISAATIYYSTNRPSNISNKIRPVVSLGADVKISVSRTASDSSGTPHSITQY